MCNNVTILAIQIIVYAQTFSCYFKILSCIQLWKLGTRCKSQIFNYTGSIHVIQHHAIKYNTIIYIAFIEIPPILMTFYVMANYESDAHIIIINYADSRKFWRQCNLVHWSPYC